MASYWESHQEQIQPLIRNTITELSAMYDELAKFAITVWRWMKKRTSWVCHVSPCRILIFTGVPYAISILRRRA